MIQRIQSLYLLVVAILMVVMMSIPMGHFVSNNGVDELNTLNLVQEGVVDGTPWALFAEVLVVAVLALTTIFLYRKRTLQIRLCVFSIIILIGFYLTLAAFVMTFMKEYNYSMFTPNLVLIAPLACIVFEWLAIRAIGKDIILVKAYDRLR